MTTQPTQAQIEALQRENQQLRRYAAAMHQQLEAEINKNHAAAAQVGERTGQEASDDATSSLDFLAKPHATQIGDAKVSYELGYYAGVTTTVERCAQVCDEAANDPRATKEYRYFCINMAAAIRRLGHEA